jgi:hypothetical protein
LTQVTRQDSGFYSALAVNAFGAALSEPAWLRVLVPQQLGPLALQADGGLQLLSQDSDGGALQQGDLGFFAAQTSTNLLDWQPLASPLVVTNGYLLLQDFIITNYALRFYRIIER